MWKVVMAHYVLWYLYCNDLGDLGVVTRNTFTTKQQLQQVERLRSENTDRRPMIPHNIN